MIKLFLSFKLALSKVCKQSEPRKFCIFKYKILANFEIRTLDVPKGTCVGGTNTLVPQTFENAGARVPATPFSYALN